MPTLTPVDFDPFAERAPTRITVRPEPRLTPVDFDPFAGATAPSQQIATEFMNQGSAAGQRTTPNVAAQMPNLISADTFESDAGEVLFRDPVSGQVIPTDQNKHVALRDPSDNRVKVFARTSDTDEGALSSAGRLLMTGMGSSAPSARPAVPLPSKAAAPTVEQLKGAASVGYQSPEVLGLEVKPSAVANFSRQTQAALNSQGIDEELARPIFKILSRLEDAPQGSVMTGQNLDTLRKTFGEAAKSINPTERKAAVTVLNALDEFVPKLGGGDVIAGDAEKAAQTLETARANYAAAKRAELIDKKQIRAELRAASANSGRNLSNTMRQRLADVLLNPKEHRGWTAGELELAERAVRGSKAENAIRLLGNMLGGGGGMGAIISAGIGGYATGGPGAIAPVIGYGLKSVSNALTMRQIGKLSEAIRSRAPLAASVGGSLTDFAKAAKAYEGVKSPRTLSMVVIASRNLANNLKDAGIAIKPADLLKSLQGPMKSSADEEQQ